MSFGNWGSDWASVDRRTKAGVSCNRQTCGCATCPAKDICAGPNPRCDARFCGEACGSCRAVCNRHMNRDGMLESVGGDFLFDDIKWKPFDLGPVPSVMFQMNTPIKRPTTAQGFIVNVRKIFYGEDSKGDSLNWSPQKYLRTRFRLPLDSLIGITFTAPDEVVDYLGFDLEETCDRIAEFEVDFVFGINFSIYENYPSFDALYNLKRRFLSLKLLQERGVKVVPDIGWLSYKDRQRVFDWLADNDIRYMARNYQTVAAKSATGTWTTFLKELEFTRKKFPDVHLFLHGCSGRKRVESIRKHVDGPITFIDAKSQRLAEFHKDLYGKVDREAHVDDLFERNTVELRKWAGE